MALSFGCGLPASLASEKVHLRGSLGQVHLRGALHLHVHVAAGGLRDLRLADILIEEVATAAYPRRPRTKRLIALVHLLLDIDDALPLHQHCVY